MCIRDSCEILRQLARCVAAADVAQVRAPLPPLLLCRCSFSVMLSHRGLALGSLSPYPAFLTLGGRKEEIVVGKKVVRIHLITDPFLLVLTTLFRGWQKESGLVINRGPV